MYKLQWWAKCAIRFSYVLTISVTLSVLTRLSGLGELILNTPIEVVAGVVACLMFLLIAADLLFKKSYFGWSFLVSIFLSAILIAFLMHAYVTPFLSPIQENCTVIQMGAMQIEHCDYTK